MRDGRYGRRRRRLDGIVDGPFDRRRAEKPLDFLLPFSLYATCFSSPSALNLSGQSLHFFLFFPCHLVLFSLSHSALASARHLATPKSTRKSCAPSRSLRCPSSPSTNSARSW